MGVETGSGGGGVFRVGWGEGGVEQTNRRFRTLSIYPVTPKETVGNSRDTLNAILGHKIMSLESISKAGSYIVNEDKM